MSYNMMMPYFYQPYFPFSNSASFFLYSGTRLLHGGSLDVSISPIKAREKRIKSLCMRPNCGVKWVISIYSMMEYSVWDKMQDVKLVPFCINLIIQSGYVSIMVWLGTKWYRFALKRKFCYFDRIFITSCTRSCQNDNLQLAIQPMMKISSKWQHFRFSVEQTDTAPSCRCNQRPFSFPWGNICVQ